MHFFHGPSIFDEATGEIVEEVGVGGRRTLRSKIFFGLDETTPEVAHPDPVDSDAGCKRVDGIDKPLGEVETITARGGIGKGGFDFGENAGREFSEVFVGPGEVTASEEVSGARLGQFLHHHELSSAGCDFYGFFAFRNGRSGGGEIEGETSDEIVIVEIVFHADGEWLAVGCNGFFEEKGDFVLGVHFSFLSATDVDGPSSLLVTVDDVGSRVVRLFVIGKGGFKTNRLAVDRDGEISEDEIPIARSARPFLWERIVREGAEPERGDGLEISGDFEVVGLFSLGGLIHEERVIGERFQAYVGRSKMVLVTNGKPIGGLC